MFNWVNEINSIKKSIDDIRGGSTKSIKELQTAMGALALIVEKKSSVYSHHFDVNLNHDNLASIPEGWRVDLNFNVISNNSTKYTKLSDIDGDGYIISAFGLMYQGNTPSTAYVFDAKLFYKALNGGTLLLNVNDLTIGSIACAVVTGLNDYAIIDSVQKV